MRHLIFCSELPIKHAFSIDVATHEISIFSCDSNVFLSFTIYATLLVISGPAYLAVNSDLLVGEGRPCGV